MCGIAGFLDLRGTSSVECLAASGTAMATSLRHRGPNDSGVWVDPEAGISLAHRRLAILDRASMAHSLEVRVPLLDHRIVGYAWRLPPRLKYGRGSENKRVLRRLLYRYVPRGLVDRPKRGFSSPIGIWLRGPLRAWADELLDQRRLKGSGLYDTSQVHACWEEHLRGTSDHWRLLWGILMFEQWRRHWGFARAGDPDVRNLAIARNMSE